MHDVFLVVDMVCPQYVLYVCVTCECDSVPDRRFILVPWNVVFCKSFVVGVLQCEFDACLSGCNQRSVWKCSVLRVLRVVLFASARDWHVRVAALVQGSGACVEIGTTAVCLSLTRTTL